MPVTPTQVILVLTLVAVLGFVWYTVGRGTWRSRLEDRFLYGLPWGTFVTVAVVVAFYLFGQGGLRNWDEPVIYAFITWSYLYPTGLVTAGISHGSPAHLLSNMTTTLVMAPIAEYAWSHYPPDRHQSPTDSHQSPTDRHQSPTDRRDDGGDSLRGLVATPWIRAFVLFPGTLLAAAFVTAVFSLGPGLGFSGAVFAIAGFAAVNYPLTTVVAVVASSALGTVYDAVTQPIVREAIEVGPPLPPDWAGIGFQAHMLGFLLGVLIGVAILRRRGNHPPFEGVFFGVFLLGMVQALWLLVWSTDDVFTLYRGAGVTLVVVLTLLVAVAVSGSNRPLPRPFSRLPRAPTRRQLAVGWLLLVLVGLVLGVAGIVLEGEAVGIAIGTLLLLAVVAAIPALPPLLPDRWFTGPVTRRGAALVVLVVFTALVAIPSVPLGLVVVDDPAIDSGVEVGDYTVAYVENETADRTQLVDFGGNETTESELSGVVLASDEREMWTVGERAEMLEYAGNATITVGDLGWRETVEVERTGWEVLGNDTVYAVDLETDGETSRSYTSDPAQANALIEGHALELVPTESDFVIRVTTDGTAVGETTVSEARNGATVGDLEIETRQIDGTEAIVASVDETEVQFAEREEYQG